MSHRRPVSGLAMVVLRLFICGVGLTPQRLLEEFIIDLGIGMGIAFFFRRLYGDEALIARSLRVTPYTALYLATFLWELLTTSIGVAMRTLSPSMPIDPTMVEVPLHVRAPLAIATITNGIALTPETLTMDYDDETSSLYVHSIDGNNPDGILKPIRRWKDYALVILGEELKPGDPTPQVEGGPAGDGNAPATTTGGEQHG